MFKDKVLRSILTIAILFVILIAGSTTEAADMATKDDLLNTLKKIPELTPQDIQAWDDYFSQVDSVSSKFGGGDILEVSEVRATNGAFEFAPLLTGKFTAANKTITSSHTVVSWDANISDYNNGVVKWSSDDPTKFYLNPRGPLSGYWITLMMFDHSGEVFRTIEAHAHFYDKDDNSLGIAYFFDVATAVRMSGIIPLHLFNEDVSYFTIDATASASDGYTFIMSMAEIK
jgi:hypothetical protein